MSALAGGAVASWALLERDVRAFLRARSQLYSSVLLPLMLLAILGTGVDRALHVGLRALAIGLIEPLVQTVAYSMHERAWARPHGAWWRDDACVVVQ